MRNKLIVLFLFLGILLLGFTKPSDKFFEISKNLDVFASLVKELDRYYVDSTNIESLTRQAIYGMLSHYDPYTNFIPEEDLQDFRTSTTGEYAGIGAQISNIDNQIYISMIYQGFVADRAGLKIGDQIVRVNNKPISNAAVSSVSSLLKGRPSSEVHLSVVRTKQADTLNFSLKREKISVKSVPYYAMLDKATGYIQLEEFMSGASKEVKEALKNLKSLGAKAIILDLRDNPGGLLSEAVNISNVFLPKNKLVVQTKGRRKEWNRSYKTLNKSVDDKIPLAILVNKESASAAEIVAGVVQDYDRGILIGNRTFGKGLVQTTRPLSYGNQVKITTAKYFIPSGRCIQSIEYSNNKKRSLTDVAKETPTGFKTRLGRLVKGGAGLTPDIIMDENNYSTLTRRLIDEGIIFKFCRELENIEHSNQDKIFDSFMRWMYDTDQISKFNSEVSAESIIEASKNEWSHTELLPELEKLNLKLKEVSSRQFKTFSDEIVQVLEIESHLHKSGSDAAHKKRIEVDEVATEAVSRLNDSKSYRLLLSKQ